MIYDLDLCQEKEQLLKHDQDQNCLNLTFLTYLYKFLLRHYKRLHSELTIVGEDVVKLMHNTIKSVMAKSMKSLISLTVSTALTLDGKNQNQTETETEPY